MSLGFIITRHVNSPATNKYWNECVHYINMLYTDSPIIIIDDNSNYAFVSAEKVHNNVTVIQSEYPKRGELLPFIYYHKYKWFPQAVIIHDSVFIRKRFDFESLGHICQVMPLWHYPYDCENLNNLIRISKHLKHPKNLEYHLRPNSKRYESMLNLSSDKNETFNLCFGCQCYIKLAFLELIHKKYNMSNLLVAINNRTDRCGLERIIGLLFWLESKFTQQKSLFGNIKKHKDSFTYTFDQYKSESEVINLPIVKVWTGR